MLAILNQYDLQLNYNPETDIAKISTKSPGARPIYVPVKDRDALASQLEQVIGTNTIIGSQGMALLAGPLSQVHPLQVTLCADKAPTDKELSELFAEIYPDNLARPGFPRIHVEPAGPNRFRVVMDVALAADFMAWSDKFQADFDLIREALKRPYARMEGDYSDPIRMPPPEFCECSCFGTDARATRAM